MGYMRDLILHADMSVINPPNLSWRNPGANNGTGVGIVASTDVVNGVCGGWGTEYNGTDERTDFGALAGVRTVSMFVNLATTTEQVIILSAGSYIHIVGGTVTYVGVAGSATYVDDVATTTIAADGGWHYLVCVLSASHDATALSLAYDGANYGALKIDEFSVFNSALTQIQAADLRAQMLNMPMFWRISHPRYLVGFWPLNNHALDVSGRGNNGTWTTEAYIESVWGKTVGEFAGASKVALGTGTILNSATGMTFVGRIRRDGTGTSNAIFARYGAAGARSYQIYLWTDNRLYFSVTSNGTAETETAVPAAGVAAIAGESLPIAAVYDGTELRAYMRGVPVGRVAYSTGIFASASNTYIGASGATGTDVLWDGGIGLCRLYNIGLTTDELTAISRLDGR